MLIIKSNDLYGTKDVLDTIRQLQQEATSLPSYLFGATTYLKTLGVDINYNNF